MISLEDYFGGFLDHPDATPQVYDNVEKLLAACALLEQRMVADGVEFPENLRTDSQVSGKTYGGFRPQDCPQGAARSAHKLGLAVDRYDPHGHIDAWLLKHPEALEVCGIYIEHPDSTLGWSHWSIKPPSSGKHIFWP